MEHLNSKRKKVGFLINPIAGIGGRVGLKGSDGLKVQQQAIALGAQPVAQNRAMEALKILSSLRDGIDLYVAANEMGETVARGCGFDPIVIPTIHLSMTTAEDTKFIAKKMCELQVDLLLFAGGDGTARDIFSAIGDTLPVIGIPSGVKIYSAVFAINPRGAGWLAQEYLTARNTWLDKGEVIDLDEEVYREGVISTRLYGYLTIPKQHHLIQNQKVPTTSADKYQIESIVMDVIEKLNPSQYYALGPGTIPNAIARHLNIEKTLVGIDLFKDKCLIQKDVNEKKMLEVLENHQLSIIVTPIGGQGFLFGRGNQQFSPRVLANIKKQNILIVSLIEKINFLLGRPLLVDTGDSQVDQMLSGYMRIITGYKESIIYPVAC